MASANEIKLRNEKRTLSKSVLKINVFLKSEMDEAIKTTLQAFEFTDFYEQRKKR